MRGVPRVLRAELYRLLRSRAAWCAALFLASISAARVFLTHASEVAREARALGGGAASGQLEGGTGWAPFVDGWRTGLTAGVLLLLLHAARTIAADRESGVLRIALTRSSSRAAVVVARALLAVPLILAVFTLTGVSAWATGALFFELGPLVEDGYEFLSVAELWQELAVAALAALPALLATYAFGLALSALLRSGASAMTVALALYLGFDLFKETLGEAQYLVFASFAPSFVDGSLLSEMSGLARGFSDAGFPDGILERNLLLPWPQALVLVGLAVWAASRRPA
jgi:ABC-type transport system involved in multi-copper enzyme maturation permease subunit